MPNKKMPDYTEKSPFHYHPDPEPDHKKGYVPLQPPPIPKEPSPPQEPPPSQPPAQLPKNED